MPCSKTSHLLGREVGPLESQWLDTEGTFSPPTTVQVLRNHEPTRTTDLVPWINQGDASLRRARGSRIQKHLFINASLRRARGSHRHAFRSMNSQSMKLDSRYVHHLVETAFVNHHIYRTTFDSHHVAKVGHGYEAADEMPH